MFTPHDYARKAAQMWEHFTPNQRGWVAMGVFPAEPMEAAEKEGFQTHPLVVALMDHHREVQRQKTRSRQP